MELNKIICGDALTVLKTFPDNFVHCCVTSPPYFSQRNYYIEGQIGLEKSIDEYIGRLVTVFDQVKRILHTSGSLWLNMGDGYATHGQVLPRPSIDKVRGEFPTKSMANYRSEKFGRVKMKDQLGLPFILAFALRNSGWYLRSIIPWIKKNAMPESVTDRPSVVIEYIFLLTKSPFYFYDLEAVRNENTGRARRTSDWFLESFEGLYVEEDALAFILNTQAYKGAHFATFPECLVEACIKAGVSEKGCCPQCLEPYERIIEPTGRYKESLEKDHNWKTGGLDKGKSRPKSLPRVSLDFNTVGWKKNCSCLSEKISKCTILDPFMGSGTTAVVSQKFGRNWVGIELSPEYVELAEKRIKPHLNRLGVLR